MRLIGGIYSLVSAIPDPDPEARRQRVVLAGDVASPVNPPAGCRCESEEPILEDIGPNRLALKHDGHRLLRLSIFHCVNYGSLALFASALPVMRVSLALSLVEIGTVLSLGLVATMVLQPLFGFLSDRGHARRILLLGFAGIVVVDLAFPVGSSFVQVLVLYVLLRSAAGIYHPVGFSSIGRT